MKKLSIVLAGAAIALGFAVISIPGFAQNGNGITSNGPHFNLNIIGVTDSKNPPLTNSDRHTIFVPLNTAQDDPVPGAGDGSDGEWREQGPPFAPRRRREALGGRGWPPGVGPPPSSPLQTALAPGRSR